LNKPLYDVVHVYSALKRVCDDAGDNKYVIYIARELLNEALDGNVTSKTRADQADVLGRVGSEEMKAVEKATEQSTNEECGNPWVGTC
jgi:hypothetical protein